MATRAVQIAGWGLLVWGIAAAGCGGSDEATAPIVDGPDASTGGAATGGAGGSSGKGGTNTGGSSTGGASTTGGNANTGGTNTGGVANTGGASATGGSGTGGVSCGGLQEPCCGTTCSAASTACVSGTCVHCGEPTEPCCGTSCNGPTICQAGTCTPCGAIGQPCCAGDLCADASSACEAGACLHCGAKDEPCCASNCDNGLTCTGTKCECGGVGQPCCLTDPACVTDLSCATGFCQCASVCSSDGSAVLDCHGQTLETCAGTQECIKGACVEPCTVASAKMSSEGCDFWGLKTDLIVDGAGACYAMYIANTWAKPVHIGVEYNGQTLSAANFTRIPTGQGSGITYAAYDTAQGLGPGQVAILFLSRGAGPLPACPAAPAFAQDLAVAGTGRGKAFHITTDKPVAAYQILPYGGGSAAATSATLLLPTNVWGTKYVAINAYQKSQTVAAAYPSLDLLAQQDNTVVTITPKVAIQGGTNVAAGPANVPIQYTLNRGEFVQISQTAELTGSVVESTAPIAMWGAASCLNVPINGSACDSAQQQIPPTKALGSRYVGVRYKGRAGQNESPPWRLVGAVDGTVLTWLPSAPAGAPAALQAGQVAEFASTGPFQVTSQDANHPYYLASYMTGGSSFGGEGDPEWVNVIPSDQYLDRYILFTDPTYPETSLVVIRAPNSSQQFADVTLDCAGTLTGWQSVGAFEYTRVNLVTGNFQNVGSCSNGRHEMHSTQPFGVTVWGWGTAASSVFSQYVSYAYPAGASVKKINDVGN